MMAPAAEAKSVSPRLIPPLEICAEGFVKFDVPASILAFSSATSLSISSLLSTRSVPFISFKTTRVSLLGYSSSTLYLPGAVSSIITNAPVFCAASFSVSLPFCSLSPHPASPAATIAPNPPIAA